MKYFPIKSRSIVISLMILFSAIGSSFLLVNGHASAASAAGFDAGTIISDNIFTNSGSMSASQIQSFLNSKVSTCDTNGTQTSEFGGGTRAQWGAAHGHPAPFTCLKDYSEGGRSAAQIIYDTAQQYQINPQVLIVLLQKEQGLVTDTWPLDTQYRTATGYGCPDTAPCDSQYYGLTNQLGWSGKMFRAIMNASSTWYSPYIVGSNYIKWNPSASCGGSTVTITNRATAALYDYTPYRPNQAALNAGYGMGDSCSAYGNRNFYLYFNDWFGSTINGAPSDLYISDGVYEITNSHSGKSLDVAGGSTANGASVQLYSSNHSAAQRWQLTRDSDGYYGVKSTASGRYLDVLGGTPTMGAKIQIWDGNDSCAQKWSIRMMSDNSIALTNKCSGYVLDITGGSFTDGSRAQTWGLNGTAAQLWAPISVDSSTVDDGLYYINSAGNLSLNVQGSSTSNGSVAQIWTTTPTDAQYWQLNRLANGLYTIRNPVSNKYLDARSAGTSEGTAIQIWDDTGSCAQKWAITKTDASSYTIRSACSDLVLDITGAAVSTSGTPLQLYTSNLSSAQKWTLATIPNGVIPNGTYTIKTSAGKVLDITGGSTANGTQLQLYGANRTAAQSWQFIKNSNGTFSIYNPNSDKYVDLAGGSSVTGRAIQLYTGNNTCAQQWTAFRNSDSSYTLLSACSSDYAIDILGGLVGNSGTKIQLYNRNYSGAQSWIIGTP
ncbi:MAG: exported protein of unknown function [Candidatus Saccharibacteria bacterium]|nr:exported protein of unknown function [Candidatus Saccharibacteria bacterium]